MLYDMIVVGAGPAGMTAALYALRSSKTVLLLEKNGFGGQITYSPKVENYPGTLQMSGNEFADRLLEQVMALGADTELEEVTSVRCEGEERIVSTADGNEYRGRTVVLATGVKHRRLGVPGEEELIGHGVSFCAVCDGAFYRDRDTAIVGGGNSALQEALLLADVCRRVTVIQNLDFLTGEGKLKEAILARKNVTILYGTLVESLKEYDGELTGVTLIRPADGKRTELAVEGLFVAVGLEPENDAFADVAKLDDRGYFDSGEDCLTRTPGVFVAGDCRRKSVRQITTAVSDGAGAAVAACRKLG